MACEICGEPNRPYSRYCSSHHHRDKRYGSPTGLPPRTIPPGATERVCHGCGEAKALTDFGPMKTGQLGLKPRCRACEAKKAAQERERRNADPERRAKHLDMQRRSHVKGAYGEAAIPAYERIQAGEPCDICGIRPAIKRSMAIDHCRITGQIRGILCSLHNRGLGMFQHDPALLRAAADYLERALAPRAS